jgi:succinyl-CoA synthetase beta subunit
VKSIFINIFGGITRGEEVANGIVEALSRVDLRRHPSSSASTAPTPRRAGPSSPHLAIPESKLTSKPTMLEAARAAVELASK